MAYLFVGAAAIMASGNADYIYGISSERLDGRNRLLPGHATEFDNRSHWLDDTYHLTHRDACLRTCQAACIYGPCRCCCIHAQLQLVKRTLRIGNTCK